MTDHGMAATRLTSAPLNSGPWPENTAYDDAA